MKTRWNTYEQMWLQPWGLGLDPGLKHVKKL